MLPKRTKKLTAKSTNKSDKSFKVPKPDKSSPVRSVKIDTTDTKSISDSTDIMKSQSQTLTTNSDATESESNKPSETIVGTQKDHLADSKTVATKKIRMADLSANDALAQAIAEIESEGSSMELDFDNDKHRSQYYNEKKEEDNQSEKLLPSNEFSEKVFAKEGDKSEYRKQSEFEIVEDFLGNLTNVPQLDDISLDLTEDSVSEIPAHDQEQVDQMDLGTFVEPLTETTASLITTKSLKEEIKETEEIAAEEGIEAIEDVVELLYVENGILDLTDDFLDQVELKESEKFVEDSIKHEVDIEAATFNQFLELETKKVILSQDEFDTEAVINEELEQQNLQYCLEFINNLIEQCIDRSEYVDSDILLRRNLDKRKLLEELKRKLPDLAVENSVKKFLNRKCVEHFRRKRTFRPIMNDNPRTLRQEMEKFRTALSNLDKWLVKEEQFKNLSSSNLANLREQVKADKDQTTEEILKFENLVRESLKRDGFDKLQASIKNSLDKISLVRKEISKVRFHLILKEHKNALLSQQLYDLEDLGNGLSMRNFENMETETQALGKKIEERNAELKKLHFHCNTDIHNMAHLKEKQKMLRHTISHQKQYLEECLDEIEKLRDTIYELKLQRTRIHFESRDLSFQGGLLDKPILMRDYDKTEESVQQLQNNISDLRAKINQLNDKIVQLEKLNSKS